MKNVAEYWFNESLYAQRGGKTDAMRNWIRDKFGVNRVRTNPTQEQRLAPEQVQPVGLPAADWINDGTYGTYAGLSRDTQVYWTSSITTTGNTFRTSYWATWYDEYMTPPKPTYPSKIVLPDGI